MRLARLGIALLCVSLPLSGCVCEGDRRAQSEVRRSRELAFFDFVQREGAPLLELWPPSPGGPVRRQRQLIAKQQGHDLVLTTDGPDPYLQWDLETPVRAGALTVELRSERAAPAQLFWTSASCKVYEERCSMVADLAVGRQTLDFALDPEQPLRGVRFDLPEVRGTNLVVHRVRFTERPRLLSEPLGHEEHTELERTSDGLRVTAGNADPWLVFATPWLDTRQVESVEVELRAPASAQPQLYWQGGACPSFSESCKAFLTPMPGRPDAYSAALAAAPSWSGRARAVRLDPGDKPGAYLLRRLVFVRRVEK